MQAISEIPFDSPKDPRTEVDLPKYFVSRRRRLWSEPDKVLRHQNSYHLHLEHVAASW